MITFTASPYTLNDHLILRLPAAESAKLSSRSQVMVTGTLNDTAFSAPLEPDGMAGHWLDIHSELASSADISPGRDARVSLEQSNDWPEPVMPKEFTDMLAAHPEAKATYDAATPMAHWEWLRWTISTKNPDTYLKHIEVSRSKLTKGMRRPCCFNRASCTTAAVAKSGVLIDPR